MRTPALASTNPSPLTLAAAKEVARTLGMSLNLKDGEYRVNYRGGSEDTAYYTNDRADAIETARAMAQRPRCGDCGEPGETTGHMGCQYPR